MKPTLSLSACPDPLYFRLLKYCTRRNIRGSWKLLGYLRGRKSGDTVFYRISTDISIEVPARNCLDQQDINRYEQALFKSLSKVASELRFPVTLIDGGGDIGIFSLKTVSICPSIDHVVAFEPNSESYALLKRNLSRLPCSAVALQAAISDFSGQGELVFPAYDPKSTHARYLEQSANGPIRVTTVDSVTSREMPYDLLLKLDLEGGELAAIRGSLETIRQARNAVVVFEAHPAVAERTGIDPLDCVKLLSRVRKFAFTVGETGQPLLADKPVFEQLPRQIFNIIGKSA